MKAPILQIDDLTVDVIQADSSFSIIRNLQLQIRRGEIYGLAGESGSGKSTLAKTILRILPAPGVIRTGSVLFAGKDLLKMDHAALKNIRWKQISIVFQSAMSALNPVLKIGEQMIETILAHKNMSRLAALDLSAQTLELVGIDSSHFHSYPHMLSGGMKQRTVLAMALLLDPDLIILDEPTTALDVIVQAHILQTIKALQQQRQFSILFISHDLPLLLDYCDRVGIMYAGRIVEEGSSGTIKSAAQHPYTIGLMHSFPSLGSYRKKLQGLAGNPPHPRSIAAGCAFHPRCQSASQSCKQLAPPRKQLQNDQYVSCFHPGVKKSISHAVEELSSLRDYQL